MRLLTRCAVLLVIAAISSTAVASDDARRALDNPMQETITLGGNPIHTVGKLPAIGDDLSSLTLAARDLSDIHLADFHGRKVILNIFPSLDTQVCATSVRKFNVAAAKLEGTVLLCVSVDLPFAMSRFCSTEGIENVVNGSAFRDPEFGQRLGLTIADGNMRGLLARAVLVLDEEGKLIYRELVSEVANEPNYEAALAAVK